jgi:hypothetical protein
MAPGRGHHGLIEKKFDIQVIRQAFVEHRRRHAFEHAIVFPFTEAGEFPCGSGQISVHLHARIQFGKSHNDFWHQRAPKRLHAGDPQFANCGIGKEFDVLDALLKLVEDGHAPPQKRIAIDGRLDSLFASIDKTHAEGVLEIGDHFRNQGA